MTLQNKKVCFWLLMLIFFFGITALSAKEKANINKKSKPDEVLSPKNQMSEHTDELRNLMLQLYETHPEELVKSTQVSAPEMTEWVFENKSGWQFDAIKGLRADQALALIFNSDYQGDHVLPLVVGLETLLFTAYGAQNEFDIPAESDSALLKQAVCSINTLVVNIKSTKDKQQPVKLALFLEKNNTQQMISGVLNSITSRIMKRNGGSKDCQ